ncbi:MAG: EAL domain-containing protein [Butyrivibrio sp.]|nr:EAL domain-containing protein [Butyrivibrio sp.]
MKNENSQITEYVVKNIDAAIKEGWIEVYYQPVIRTLTGQLCGAESLARWKDPVHRLLSPDKFIGALEDSKQIHKLDCFVVEKVCSDISKRLNDNLEAVPVSVNFSRLDFETADMLKVVEDAIEKYSIPRDYLHIEITESMIVSDALLMERIIESFRNAGFEIWMDDFGSGYSSLNLLKDYQFDTVKMDMEFLSSFTEKSQSIMTSAISMAKDIGVKTLAEGVETAEQVDFLYSIGCGKLQGYFYGKPMPLDEFFDHIARTGITIEPRKLRHYYQKASFSARYTEEPLEIIEDDGENFRTLFMNKAYQRQIVSSEYTLEELDELVYHTNSPLIQKYREYANTIESTKNRETFYYTFDGNILCFQGEELAEWEGKHLIKGSIRNISIDSDFKTKTSVGGKLRELNHLFETVMLVNIEKQTIEPLIGKDKYVVTDGDTNNLQKKLERLANECIAPSDREKFNAFSDSSTFKKRIAASGKGFIENIFKFKQKDGNYRWREMSVMMVPGSAEKEYLICTKATTDDAQRFLSSNNHVHNPEDYGLTNKNADVQAKLFEGIVADSSIKFFWKDTDRRYLGASKAYLDFLDVKIEDILGKRDEDMGWFMDEKALEEGELEVLNKGIFLKRSQGQCIVNGIAHNIMSDKRPIYDNGQIIGLIGHCIDVDEQLSYLDKLYNERRLDPVTGLMNVSALADVTRTFTHNYATKKTDFALLILRNENHHRIVEDFGDGFGNKLLKRAAEIIVDVTEGKCAVAKCIGSDFAVVTDDTKPEEINTLIEELRTKLEDIKKIEGNDITVKIRIGCKLRSDEGITDENMYTAVLDEFKN